MTDTAQLRSLILSLDGVHTVYPADPAWKTTARRIRNALSPGEHSPGPEYVRLRSDRTSTSLMVRVGADGTVPTGRLTAAIAAALRAALDDGSAPGTLNITIEISSIRHPPAASGAEPAP